MGALSFMLSDFRYALRQLAKVPSFTLVAVVTLALGIGACTAIFSVVNGVLLQPLDYPNPDRLVVIKESSLPQHPEFSSTPPNFLDWEQQAKSFVSLAAYSGQALNLTGDGEPQRINAIRATAHYFDVYGIKPQLGRFPRTEEDSPGNNHVVVLSYPFWQRRFGGQPEVIGRTVELNGDSYTVIGIAPLGFGQQSRLDAWVPMAFSPKERSDDFRGAHFLSVMGRLKDGVTASAADAELKLLAAQLAQRFPDSNKGWSATATPALHYTVRDVSQVLYVLLAAVGCVLLIACANVANLQLARATARHREISIRAALGAGNRQLIRQLLTESLVLALLGGIAGVLLASWGLSGLVALAPSNLPRAANIHLNGTVLLFSFGLSVLTGLIFGLAPAWFATRVNVNDALKQGSRGSTDTGSRGRLRRLLVVGEVAVSLVLLSGAGLLIRSFERLAAVDPGFVAADATVVRLFLPAKKYDKPEQQLAFANAIVDRLRTLPGVTSVGIANTLPLVGDWVLSLEIEGRPLAASDLPSTNYYAVTPGYFPAMGIRLLRGRAFTEHDDERAPHVAVINETFARTYFPNEDPIGKRINVTNGPQTWREIVGVVADVKQYGPDQATTAQAYEPFAQKPFSTLAVVIRTHGPSAAMLSALRPAVYAVDAAQPVGNVQPLEEILSGSIARQRFTVQLLSIFAAVALVLAAIGIYGVMAYTVAQRTSEIGLRMALGARPADVFRLIFSQSGRMIGLGIALGLAVTLAASRAVSALLFQTSAFDPLTLAAVLLLLMAAAALACLLPARRATKVDPIVALRAD